MADREQLIDELIAASFAAECAGRQDWCELMLDAANVPKVVEHKP